jgi:hypothetical protein
MTRHVQSASATTLAIALTLFGCGAGNSNQPKDASVDRSGGSRDSGVVGDTRIVDSSASSQDGSAASLDSGTGDRVIVGLDAALDLSPDLPAATPDMAMPTEAGHDGASDRAAPDVAATPDSPSDISADGQDGGASCLGTCSPDGGGTGGLDGSAGTKDGGAAGSKRIYAVNYNSANGSDNVTSYPAEGTGDIAPIGKIAGPSTKLGGIVQMAFDGSGKIYVLGRNGLTYPAQSIEVFVAGADGDVAPIATLAGPSTGLVGALSLAVDNAGKMYVAGSIPCSTCTSATHPGIMVFAVGANGDTAPQQIIAPAVYPAVDNTGLDASDLFVGVDAGGNIYTADSYSQKVLVFAPNANGNVAPLRVLLGDKTLLSGCEGVAFDSAGNLYIANYNGMSVTVYPPGASGNVAPAATITGANTGIGMLAAIAVDTAGTVWASGQAVDSTGRLRNAILRFAPGTNGNVAPVAALAGGDTEIDATSLAVY